MIEILLKWRVLGKKASSSVATKQTTSETAAGRENIRPQMTIEQSEPAHPAHALPTNICRKHRTQPIPPDAHRLMGDIDPTLEQKVLCIPQ